ncbi:MULTISPECIES: nucleoside triphosphate pyrophosphatase [Atopobiaceae]|uniref:Maf family protein n=1 Tax=Atopobiaceae TaxID=1643824 RepID=UPI00034E8213|nr:MULTISPECIES: Maf family protein [Atopobiaceae]EPD77968.1 septum formation protein Maf [Atopobium sp. oral taxon 199 str. F0494]
MILASQSPRRLELIESLGITPQVMPADIDESRKSGEAPLALVKRLAQEKAVAVCRHLMNNSHAAEKNNEIVIAADTIVWTENETVFGKPHDAEDAKRMLRMLSGKTHFVSTGVALRRFKAFASPSPDGSPSVIAVAFVQTTKVTFYELSEDEITAYVASGESSDKAGAYGIQGRGRFLVQAISGDYENVVGLPVALLARELVKFTGNHDYLEHALEGSA